VRKTTALIAVLLVVFGPTLPLVEAAHPPRGSVSGASHGSWSHSGNTSSWQGRGGNASGSRTVTQTGTGATASRQAQTQSGATRDVNRTVDTENKTVDRSSTVTNPQGQTASRERTTEAQGGYATVEGSAKTSTGREAEGQATVGRNVYGQPAVAGSVNTKYSGSYAGAAARNPYGGWTSATVGPYGGKVTTTLPSGYRTTSYYGRPYYSYGGAYYRPYMYGGIPYYYPVPPPYYAYYDQPPVGAMILVVAGVTYLVSQQGSYQKQTTSSEGKTVYQAVPAPEGAQLKTLPAGRALVTTSGTTYYLYSNTFYRRVVQGTQEQFVVVSPPAGVVFVPALPADFQVVQLNTMYFAEGGRYYVPYLSADGKELYVLVDAPPQPPKGAPAAPAPAVVATAATAPAPPIRSVAETLTVPTGTLVLVRLQTDISSASATQGDRFQAFLDQDIAAGGRLIVARGARVYGVVTSVDDGSKMKGKASLGVELTDIQIGDQVVSIKTQPLQVQGEASSGAKKLAGGALLGAAIGAIADGGKGAAIGAGVGAGAGGAAAAAGKVDPAVLPAQKLQSFTVAVSFQIPVMTNVAVR
jgi:Family of unknown function (DUF6515)